MPDRSSRTSRGEVAAERILTAARAELAVAGDVEVAAIARRAGVSVGLPFRYFGSRSGLLVAVINDFYDRLEQATDELGREATWEERERRRVTDYVGFLYTEPLAPVVLTRAVGDAEAAAIGFVRLQRAIEVGARNIAAAQRTGELPADRDPELMVAAMLGGIQTAMASALARQPRPDQAELAAELWAFVRAASGVETREK
jgi:AcrR family transcriptional regulator